MMYPPAWATRAFRRRTPWSSKGAALLAVPLLLAASACDGSDDDDGGTSFNAFVHELVLTNTADDTDPVPLDGLQFRFDEDPDAFDDLFP